MSVLLPWSCRISPQLQELLAACNVAVSLWPRARQDLLRASCAETIVGGLGRQPAVAADEPLARCRWIGSRQRRLGSHWRQGHCVSKLLEPTNVMAFDARAVELVEVIDSEFGIRTACG